jgi:hypothetical protein
MIIQWHTVVVINTIIEFWAINLPKNPLQYRYNIICLQQGRQCTYNVILMCVRVTIVVKETQQLFPFVLLVKLHVAASSINPFSVAMETEEYAVPFALLSCYKTFDTAVNDTIARTRSSCRVPDIVVIFWPNPELHYRFPCTNKPPRSTSRKFVRRSDDSAIAAAGNRKRM